MREQLIRVFTDTVSHIENGEYNKDLHCSKNRLSSIELDSDLIKKPGVITVENLDCIEVASRLSKEGKTCMLNMASYKSRVVELKVEQWLKKKNWLEGLI